MLINIENLTLLIGEKTLWFVVFAYFCDLNNANMTDFNGCGFQQLTKFWKFNPAVMTAMGHLQQSTLCL